ncbi:MAG: NAD(P)H-dependent oxidoreductase subunit E [Candidatus Omnitrophota bacterium]
METEIERILKRHKYSRSSLIAILQDIQAEYNYLPEKALRGIAEGIGIPFSKIFSAATFFRAFSLKPRGKHLITVCLGTACHVRGGARLVEEIGRILEVKPGETTDDQRFTLETVNCLGCCAIGPIMVVDGKYFGEVTPAKIKSIIKGYE